MSDNKIKLIALCGIILCLTAVAIGAFGAHAFKPLLIVNQKLDVFNLANRYQFYHGLALIAVAALFANSDMSPELDWPIRLMLIGTIVFCVSLYLLALLNVAWLGAVTPIGGTLLIVAWGLLAIKLLKFKS